MKAKLANIIMSFNLTQHVDECNQKLQFVISNI